MKRERRKPELRAKSYEFRKFDARADSRRKKNYGKTTGAWMLENTGLNANFCFDETLIAPGRRKTPSWAPLLRWESMSGR